MIINHEKKFIFVAVPKTASSSIHGIFGHRTGHPEPDIHHMTTREIIQTHPETINYFKFGFVRNPWARLVSVYFDFTLQRKTQYSALVRHDKPLLSEFKDFEDFCLNLKNSSWANNLFFRPQIDFLTLENGRTIDFVGRYEYLKSDMHMLLQLIGWEFDIEDLPADKVGLYHGCYKDFYKTAAMIESVAEFYSKDIKAFGYAF